MDSYKVEAVSKRSQAYIDKRGYSLRDTAQLLGKLSCIVQKWSKRGKNGTFEREKGSGRPSKISSKILPTLETSTSSATNLQENSVGNLSIQDLLCVNLRT